MSEREREVATLGRLELQLTDIQFGLGKDKQVEFMKIQLCRVRYSYKQ